MINQDETSQSCREMFTIFSKKKLLKIHSSKAELWTIFGERNFTYICECSHLLLRERDFFAAVLPNAHYNISFILSTFTNVREISLAENRP